MSATMNAPRVLKFGECLTLDEHKALAGHLKAALYHLREARRMLDGRAYSSYSDRLDRLAEHGFLCQLRSRLEDELARLAETKTMDNREFMSIYYGELRGGR